MILWADFILEAKQQKFVGDENAGQKSSVRPGISGFGTEEVMDFIVFRLRMIERSQKRILDSFFVQQRIEDFLWNIKSSFEFTNI
jgi:hypothetical protein